MDGQNLWAQFRGRGIMCFHQGQAVGTFSDLCGSEHLPRPGTVDMSKQRYATSRHPTWSRGASGVIMHVVGKVISFRVPITHSSWSASATASLASWAPDLRSAPRRPPLGSGGPLPQTQQMSG